MVTGHKKTRTFRGCEPHDGATMSKKPLVALYGNPSFRGPIAIEVISANGTENDSELTLCIESDPQEGGFGSRTRSISPEEAARIWSLLDGIENDSAEGSVIGLDGTFFSLKIERSGEQASFSWWGNSRSEWEDVGLLADKLLRLAGPDAASLRRG